MYVAQAGSVARGQSKSWRVYSPPDKSFSVALPAPLIKVKSFDGEHGVDFDPEEDGKGISSYSAIETTSEDARFGIVVINGRLKSLRSPKREEYLEYLSWLLVADDDELQFLSAPVVVQHNGLTGNEYVYVKENTLTAPLFTRGRIFDTGSKIYVLVFVGRDTKDLTSLDAERFLNSFRLRRRR